MSSELQSILIVFSIALGGTVSVLSMHQVLFAQYLKKITNASIEAGCSIDELVAKEREGELLRVYFYIQKAYRLFRALIIIGLWTALVFTILNFWGVPKPVTVPMASVVINGLVFSGLAFTGLGHTQKRYCEKWDM